MYERIRKVVTRAFAHVPWGGPHSNLGGTDEEHFLDEEGAIESHVVQHLRPHHCGCFGSPGAVCSGCKQIICSQCASAARAARRRSDPVVSAKCETKPAGQ